MVLRQASQGQFVPLTSLNSIVLLQVLRQASEGVFVPLTVGGGIRGFTDGDGKKWSALEVAAEYFRSGADKVSIGGDAVYAAEEYRRTGKKTGSSSIEQISWVGSVPLQLMCPESCSVHAPPFQHVRGAAGGPPCTLCRFFRLRCFTGSHVAHRRWEALVEKSLLASLACMSCWGLTALPSSSESLESLAHQHESCFNASYERWHWTV